MREILIGNTLLTVTGELPTPNRASTLLCVGSAPGGVEQAPAYAAENACDVAASNEAITLYPGALYLAASLHEDKLPGWVAARSYRKVRPCVVANDPLPEGAKGALDAVVAMNRPCGSSGMYLALLGRAMGYERIVLTGITIESEHMSPYRDIWRAAKKSGALDGVQSFTPGWLAQLLKGHL